jgi:hypothetical protein
MSNLQRQVTAQLPYPSVNVTQKFPVLSFVDRQSFNTLQGHNFTFSDFPKVLSNYAEQHPAISKMTQAYLCHVNNEMYRILFGNDFEKYRDQVWGDFTKAETQGFHDQFLSVMSDEWPVNSGSLFEILPVDGENYLVVMENGFLHHVTSTKGNLEEFVLACLRHQHQFKSDKSLLIEMYLNLRLIPAYHTLMRLRVH